MTTTPISEEANDVDHEASDQITTKPRRSTRVRSAPEWYGNPILEVMLLDQGKPTNYEEAMVSPDYVSMACRSSSKSTKVHTLFSYMDPISDFMVSSHLQNLGSPSLLHSS